MTYRELCIRARKLGAARLIFTADIYGHETGWTCVGGDKYGYASVGVGHGPTGVEALANLVARLERVAA